MTDVDADREFDACPVCDSENRVDTHTITKNMDVTGDPGHLPLFRAGISLCTDCGNVYSRYQDGFEYLDGEHQ